MLARPVRLRSRLAHASRGATDLGHTRAGHTGGKQTWERPALQSACFREIVTLCMGTVHRGMLRSVSLRTRIERCAGGETHRSGHASERRGDSLALGTKPGGRLAPG